MDGVTPVVGPVGFSDDDPEIDDPGHGCDHGT